MQWHNFKRARKKMHKEEKIEDKNDGSLYKSDISNEILPA